MLSFLRYAHLLMIAYVGKILLVAASVFTVMPDAHTSMILGLFFVFGFSSNGLLLCNREFANCLRSFSTMYLRHSVSKILQPVEKASIFLFLVSVSSF